MKLKALILPLFIGAAMVVQAEETAPLPKVLIIGDSISKGYSKHVREILAGKVVVKNNPKNAQDSKFGRKMVRGWVGRTDWDVIHFNHGLHDMKYLGKNNKVAYSEAEADHIKNSLEEYGKNMEAIVLHLKKTDATLIFATTTPCLVDVVNPVRKRENVPKYNAVAMKVMQKHGALINDLYGFALPQLEQIQKPLDVHFSAEGSEVLAQEVARQILKALGQE